jgi:hypothetical protein
MPEGSIPTLETSCTAATALKVFSSVFLFVHRRHV